MFDKRVKEFLLYGGIDQHDFDSIRPMLWRRNLGLLRITAALATGIGAIFLAMNAILQSGNLLPYIVLLLSGTATLALLPAMHRERSRQELRSMLMCYGQMLLICGYAVFLSTQPANHDIPATSAILFIALLPLTIDDRPIRMFVVMLLESIAYLLASHALKSAHAFSLDAMNVVTFCAVGMVLYAVICTRSIRELHQSERIEHLSFQVIETLANAIDAKDPYTKGHSTRVSQYSVLLAKALGWKKERVNDLRYAALLHDVGKIGVPDSILNKPEHLTGVEFDIIKSHTTMGNNILRGKTMVKAAEDVARCHHERYDGKGYPSGLKGEEIPEEARIVSIADAFDAMSSNRVYRSACDREHIRNELVEGRGRQFDPVFVDKFIELWDQGALDDCMEKDPEWHERRGDVISASLHEAVESFVSENVNPDKLVADIRNSGSYEGAMNVDYLRFTKLYEFIANLKKRFDHPFTLIVITLGSSSGEAPNAHDLEKAMFYMHQSIMLSIRDVDVVTRYNQRQFLVILLGTESQNTVIAVDRIFKGYFKMSGSDAFTPSYSIVEQN